MRIGCRARPTTRLAGGDIAAAEHSDGVKNVALRSLIHERVASDRHGRAFAVDNGLRNTAELVALAGGGLLVATLGARGTLLIAGAVSALAGAAGLVVLRRRRLTAPLFEGP